MPLGNRRSAHRGGGVAAQSKSRYASDDDTASAGAASAASTKRSSSIPLGGVLASLSTNLRIQEGGNNNLRKGKDKRAGLAAANTNTNTTMSPPKKQLASRKKQPVQRQARGLTNSNNMTPTNPSSYKENSNTGFGQTPPPTSVLVGLNNANFMMSPPTEARALFGGRQSIQSVGDDDISAMSCSIFSPHQPKSSHNNKTSAMMQREEFSYDNGTVQSGMTTPAKNARNSSDILIPKENISGVDETFDQSSNEESEDEGSEQDDKTVVRGRDRESMESSDDQEEEEEPSISSEENEFDDGFEEDEDDEYDPEDDDESFIVDDDEELEVDEGIPDSPIKVQTRRGRAASKPAPESKKPKATKKDPPKKKKGPAKKAPSEKTDPSTPTPPTPETSINLSVQNDDEDHLPTANPTTQAPDFADDVTEAENHLMPEDENDQTVPPNDHTMVEDDDATAAADLTILEDDDATEDVDLTILEDDDETCVVDRTNHTPKSSRPVHSDLFSPETVAAAVVDDDDDYDDGDVLVATILSPIDIKNSRRVPDTPSVSSRQDYGSVLTTPAGSEVQSKSVSPDLGDSMEYSVDPAVGRNSDAASLSGNSVMQLTQQFEKHHIGSSVRTPQKDDECVATLKSNSRTVKESINSPATTTTPESSRRKSSLKSTLKSPYRSPNRSMTQSSRSLKETTPPNRRISRGSNRRFHRSEGSIKPGKWSLGSKIGVGSFGVVHVGMNMETGTLMAVKSFQMSTSTMKDVRAEVELMRSLNHKNIVRYFGAQIETNVLHIFQEWVPAGSVSEMLKKFGSFSISVIRSYLSQTLTGLAYLHENHILHRDIKGSNLLVSDEGIVKLADFGASKQLANLQDDLMMSMTVRGTPYFMAPEVFEEKYSSKADIWSVGCVAFQMVTGSPPWKDKGFTNPVSLFNHLKKRCGPPSMRLEERSNIASDEKMFVGHFEAFVRKCFHKNPPSRPTARALLEDPFFIELHHDHSDNECTPCKGLFSPGGNTVYSSPAEKRPPMSPSPHKLSRSKSVVQWKTTFMSPPRPRRIGGATASKSPSPMKTKSSPLSDSKKKWPSYATEKLQNLPQLSPSPKLGPIQYSSPVRASPSLETKEWPGWAKDKLKTINSHQLTPESKKELSQLMDSLALSPDSTRASGSKSNPFARRTSSTSKASNLKGLDFLGGSTDATFDL